MISVVFALTLSGVGRVVGAVVELIDRLPGQECFEISQDGEYLYTDRKRYDFVGFSSKDEYITPAGDAVKPGRKLGRVVNDDGYSIRRMASAGNADNMDVYVMLSGADDMAEIYRLHR